MTENSVVQIFIQQVKTILDEEGANEAGLDRIADTMRWLVERSDDVVAPESPEGNIHNQRQARPLYTDETGLTLVQATFGPEQITPIHSHGAWGVIGVYGGRDRYQIWRRNDEGDGAGSAEVELVEERILDRGDVVVLPPPPQDIHAQQGFEGETAYEFVLFGQNVMELPRLYFDPASKQAEEVRLGG